jgi:hypothetical protein
MVAQTLAHVKWEIEFTRRKFDDLLINLLKASNALKADGFIKEAEAVEKAAELVQGKDNDFFLAAVSVPNCYLKPVIIDSSI